MAERVVIVDHGEVIADDTPEALKARLAGDRLVVHGPDPRRLAALAERLAGAREVRYAGTRVEARVGDGPGALPELIRAAAAANLQVTAAQVYRPTLDDVFLALTGRSLREEQDDTTGKEAA